MTEREREPPVKEQYVGELLGCFGKLIDHYAQTFQ
jgi:hypothetical protein